MHPGAQSNHVTRILSLDVQVLQQIPGRTSADEPGHGHLDCVLSLDTHPTKPIIASGGHEKDATVKLWQHQPVA